MKDNKFVHLAKIYNFFFVKNPHWYFSVWRSEHNTNDILNVRGRDVHLLGIIIIIMSYVFIAIEKNNLNVPWKPPLSNEKQQKETLK